MTFHASIDAGAGNVLAARRATALLVLVLVVAISAIAISQVFTAQNYVLFRLTLAITYAVAVLGLGMVSGWSGQISLGHGAFFAIGAYGTAILIGRYGCPYWIALLAGMAISGLVGWIVGFPALRFKGLYLALTTFSLAVAVPQILKHPALEYWTGGVQGIFIVKPEAPFGLPLSQDQYVYLLTLIAAGAVFLLAWNLRRGGVGRSIVAARDNAVAAEAMGIDLTALKTKTFALSAAVTALAGGLNALAVEFVAPDSFTVALSISLFVGMIVGGAQSIVGALIGGLFILFVPNLAESVSKAATGAAYGAILLAVLFAAPDGVVGVARRFYQTIWIHRMSGRGKGSV